MVSDRIHEDAMTRRADLIQLEQIAAGYPSRERFLTELTLDPPDATSDQAGVPLLDEDYLILSTIHSAKGQEWKPVFVLNVVDGCIASDLGAGTTAEIEEERRLLYVAMTRAKDDLHLLVPQRFFTHQQTAHGDRHVYASRTRFIPQNILPYFAAAAWPVASSESIARARAPPVYSIARRIPCNAIALNPAGDMESRRFRQIKLQGNRYRHPQNQQYRILPKPAKSFRQDGFCIFHGR